MAILYLEENSCRADLLPFTATRSVLDIRVGILTFREKWERLLGPGQFALVDTATGETALPANVLPNETIAKHIRETLKKGPLTQDQIDGMLQLADRIKYPWHIFHYNGEALRSDFTLMTAARTSPPIPESVQTIHSDAIFIEEGARLHHCMLNASTGPIYIGKNAEIMEGALIRGPFAACEDAVVKMGATIYGATTLGPSTVAGGEIKNTVFFGYSNKGHHGYLGDSVIGEWCNLGAGTSNSNLKNNAGEVKVWHPASGTPIAAGLKCGLLMADYSRCAINTSFNTGTVVGVLLQHLRRSGPAQMGPRLQLGNGPKIRVGQGTPRHRQLEETEKSIPYRCRNAEFKPYFWPRNKIGYSHKIMRQQIAAANWKMNLTYQQGEQLLDTILKEDVRLDDHHQAIFAVPFPYLIMANQKLAGKKTISLRPRTVPTRSPAPIPAK
ncbi:putative sugar nucleotidyl transferase [Puia sp. P3]|uniref:putative sugar nucleotidyl transferase n=1 Tax=Puia sp. P3 TaxID=3423952 RepID=UPI003D667225